jgi:hypothetical protein
MLAAFTMCIFVSAFLLFLVEPMVAKMVLPLAGGTPAVWATSVLFFQAVLLIGYGYSHTLAARVPWRWQVAVHSVLLLAAIAFLPIHLIPGWNPPTSGTPIGWLVLVLSVAVGLPFLVLSTTSPLVQHWFSRTGHPHAADPYFLYRASNLGSAAGLLSYPFLIEPLVGLHDQARAWEAAYFAFLLLVALTAAAVLLPRMSRRTAGLGAVAAQATKAAAATHRPADKPITWRRRVRWILLAAVPSTWMLAVTSYFTTEIRPMPLLWVIPLALYLLSFTVVFARRPLVPRYWINRLFPFYALPLLGMVLLGGGGPFWFVAVLHFGAFFLGALLCHGELAHDRPPANRLTEFYWWVALGGAGGGLIAAVIGPLVFNDFLEYPLAIVGAGLLRSPSKPATSSASRARTLALPAGLGAVPVALAGLLLVPSVKSALDGAAVTPTVMGSDLARVLVVFAIPAAVSVAFLRRPQAFASLTAVMLVLSLLPLGSQVVIFQTRDFFGVHKVMSSGDGKQHILIDGGTVHGVELMDAAGRDVPASYFSRSGPVGNLFATEDSTDASWNVAVIGLGAGTVACYARPQQSWTFYEIDPAMIRIATDPSLFTFMHDCAPRAGIVLGDGRLKLALAPEHSYDLIMLDAFGSDAPPVHLLTREAIQLYRSKLKPGGVLLFNISNRFVELAPVLAGEAAALDLVAYERLDTSVTAEQARAGKFVSDWVVIADQSSASATALGSSGWHALKPVAGFPLWTDDFNDVLSVTRLG